MLTNVELIDSLDKENTADEVQRYFENRAESEKQQSSQSHSRLRNAPGLDVGKCGEALARGYGSARAWISGSEAI